MDLSKFTSNKMILSRDVTNKMISITTKVCCQDRYIDNIPGHNFKNESKKKKKKSSNINKIRLNRTNEQNIQ